MLKHHFFPEKYAYKHIYAYLPTPGEHDFVLLSISELRNSKHLDQKAVTFTVGHYAQLSQMKQETNLSPYWHRKH
jgi:hypothetical protein